MGVEIALLSPAIASEVICKGTLGSIVVSNLSVPPGQTCILKGTTVKGDIVVDSNATLLATNTKIQGNITSRGARCIYLGAQTTVEGMVLTIRPSRCIFQPKF